MRQVDRSKEAIPSILEKPFKKSGILPAGSELDRAVHFFSQPRGKKKFTFKRYKEDKVKKALENLFHGKCAYCETYYSSTQPMDVEHYRPKGNVAGTDHGGYWWLAADWENLLPSCIDCNRRRKQKLPDDISLERRAEIWDDDLVTDPNNMGKKDLFPLELGSNRAAFIKNLKKRKQALQNEKRLLLDPTRDDPEEFISFNGGGDDRLSLVLPWGKDGIRNEIGLASTQVYGLNRLGLVQARTRILRDLEFLMEIFINIETLGNNVSERKSFTEQAKSGASAAEKVKLTEDIKFYKTVSASLNSIQADIISKFKEMMDPKAPYSALSKAWYHEKQKQRALIG